MIGKKNVFFHGVILLLAIGSVGCKDNKNHYQENGIVWTKINRFNKLSSRQQATMIITTESILKKIRRKVSQLKRQGIEFKNVNLDVSGGGTKEENDLFIVATIEFFEPTEKTIILYDNWASCPEPDSPKIKKIIDDFVKEIILNIIIPGQISL